LGEDAPHDRQAKSEVGLAILRETENVNRSSFEFVARATASIYVLCFKFNV